MGSWSCFSNGLEIGAVVDFGAKTVNTPQKLMRG